VTNKSGNLGTAAESATVKAFKRAGFRAKRLTLHGNKDVGDIDVGFDEVCVEVKGGHAAERASDKQVREWLVETEVERVNAGAEVGVLVLKRKGIGYDRAEEWWAVVDVHTLHRLTAPEDMPIVFKVDALCVAPVRLHLGTMIGLLRHYLGLDLDTPTETT